MGVWHVVAVVLLACPAWGGVVFPDGGPCGPPCSLSGGSVNLACPQAPCDATCSFGTFGATFPQGGQFRCSNAMCSFWGGNGSTVECDVSSCDIRVGDDSTVTCAGQCVVTAGERLQAFREYVGGSLLTLDAGNDAVVSSNVNGEVKGSFGANAQLSGPGFCDVSVGPGSTVSCAMSRVLCRDSCVVVTAASCTAVTCASGRLTSGVMTCSCGGLQADAGPGLDAGLPAVDGGASDAGSIVFDAGASDAGGFSPVDAGVIDAGAGGVDGGSTPDAGPVTTMDAGTVTTMDAGTMAPAPMDAGTVAPMDAGQRLSTDTTPALLTVGCGCQAVETSSLLAVAVVGLRMRRRRRTL